MRKTALIIIAVALLSCLVVLGSRQGKRVDARIPPCLGIKEADFTVGAMMPNASRSPFHRLQRTVERRRAR
jgi:hypothetical protein